MHVWALTPNMRLWNRSRNVEPKNIKWCIHSTIFANLDITRLCKSRKYKRTNNIMLNNCCSAYPAGEHWVLAVDPDACINEEDSVQEEKAPIAIHFVVDNSGSMGSMTREVMYIFADMVDSVATAPCSMTVFAGNGKWIKGRELVHFQSLRSHLTPWILFNIRS